MSHPLKICRVNSECRSSNSQNSGSSKILGHPERICEIRGVSMTRHRQSVKFTDSVMCHSVTCHSSIQMQQQSTKEGTNNPAMVIDCSFVAVNTILHYCCCPLTDCSIVALDTSNILSCEAYFIPDGFLLSHFSEFSCDAYFIPDGFCAPSPAFSLRRER